MSETPARVNARHLESLHETAGVIQFEHSKVIGIVRHVSIDLDLSSVKRAPS